MLITLYGDSNKDMWQSLVSACTELPDTYYIQANHNLVLAGYYRSPIIKKIHKIKFYSTTIIT